MIDKLTIILWMVSMILGFHLGSVITGFTNRGDTVTCSQVR